MSKRSISKMLAVGAFAAGSAMTSFTASAQAVPITPAPGTIYCGVDSAGVPVDSQVLMHFNKILFHLEGTEFDCSNIGLGALQPADVKILADPSGVTNLTAEVVKVLAACTSPPIASEIVVENVAYSVACGDPNYVP